MGSARAAFHYFFGDKREFQILGMTNSEKEGKVKRQFSV